MDDACALTLVLCERKAFVVKIKEIKRSTKRPERSEGNETSVSNVFKKTICNKTKIKH